MRYLTAMVCNQQKGRQLLISFIEMRSFRGYDNLLENIRLLLQVGADPDVADNDGDSALHILANLNGEIIDSAAQLFVDAGAHLDMANKQGRTPVEIGLKYRGLRDGRQLPCDAEIIFQS